MGFPGGAESGVALASQPTVEVRSANGSRVVGATSAVTVALSGGGGASLSGTTTVAAVNGVATFSGLTVSGAAGTFTLVFSSAGLTSTTSGAVTLSQVVRQIAITSQPTGAQSGSIFSPQPTIELRDAANLKVATATNAVTAAISAGAGGTLNGTSIKAAANGIVTYSDLGITGAGTFTLSFSTGGLPTVFSSGITVTLPPATQLALTGLPTGAESGVALATQPVVEVRDASGARVLGATNAVSVSLSGAGSATISGTTTVSAVNGVATFAGITVSGAAGSFTLVFSSTGLTGVSSSVVVLTQVVRQLAINVQPAGALSTLSLVTQPVIELRDAANIKVAAATNSVTAAFASGTGGILNGTKVKAAVGGVVTYTDLGITGLGTFTLSFSATGASTVNSSNIVVTAPPPDALEITPTSSTVSLGRGQAQQFVVRAKRGGNIVNWPTGARAAWTLSNTTAAHFTQDNDTTATVTADNVTASTTITLTAQAASLTSAVTFSVIPPSSASSVGVRAFSPTFSNISAGADSLDLLVFDVNGVRLTGLAPSNFTFASVTTSFGRVSLTPRTIRAPSSTTSTPFSAVLVMDQSGSMTSTDPFSARYSAAKQFALGMQTGDESALYTFSSPGSLTRRVNFTGSATQITTAVDNLAFDAGNTALYDAGVAACSYAQSGKNANRAVILLTDGDDNSSSSTLSALITSCAAAGVRVFAVGFGDSRVDILGQIATGTQGFGTFSSDVGTILSAVRGIPAVLRAGATSDRLVVDLGITGGSFPSAGSFNGTFTVSTTFGSVTGSYSLAWNTCIPTAGVPRALAFLTTAAGTACGGSQVDQYTFSSTSSSEGLSLIATASSAALDPDLRLIFGSTTLGGNRNYGPSAGEWIIATSAAVRNYTAEVRAAPATAGGYTLQVERCRVLTSTSNGVIAGSLLTSDCNVWSSASTHYATFVNLQATAGQQVDLTLTSSNYDTFMYLFAPDGTLVTSDDDSGGGTNSRITVRVGATGTYTLVASSYFAGATGNFQLSVNTSNVLAGLGFSNLTMLRTDKELAREAEMRGKPSRHVRR